MATNGIKIAIVGGGLAGLAAAMKIAESGHSVDLFSVVPVKRSHSVCAQGGINGAVNTKGEGDSTWEHFDDTVYGGDFLANQPPAKAMCEMAPSIIYLFDRMGVPFSRTKEGLLDFRRFGGTKHHRTAFAGASTGQQLLYALDEQVRRREVEGKVQKYEGWEMMSLILDDHQVCRGIVAMNLQTLELKAFKADAVIMATGGPGLIYGKSTNSMVCTGSAVSACYQQGAKYANGEFIQVHPTSIPGEDKLRLMSESARGEGGRVWVPRQQNDTRDPTSIPESERWYFLEEKYPAYGNLVPRDIATREIFQVCLDGMGIGIDRLHFLLPGAQPRHFAERAREAGQRTGAAFRLGALMRFEMTAADDYLDQRQLALDRTRHPFDQPRAGCGRRIIETLDRGALDARARFILAPGGSARPLLLHRRGRRLVLRIDCNRRRIVDVVRGGDHRRLARGDGGSRFGCRTPGAIRLFCSRPFYNRRPRPRRRLWLRCWLALGLRRSGFFR
ncbi:MAG TPA: FAD-binding protein [Pyrinomonadaceae bacterium]|nr:FAD-binding protein [Pyrinomonadaceae bacterium]